MRPWQDMNIKITLKLFKNFVK